MRQAQPLRWWGVYRWGHCPRNESDEAAQEMKP